MSSHRDSSDSAFESFLTTLSSASLDTRIAAFEALKIDLQAESTLLQTHDSQIAHHSGKVNKTHSDLNTLKAFDLNSGSVPTLVDVETKSFSSIGSIINYIFDVGSNTRGYVTINASGTLSANNWFDVKFQSSLIDSTNSNGYFWQDLFLVPSSASHEIIEQSRSFDSGVMRIRAYLENSSVYSGSELCKIFFRVTQ